MFASGLGLAIWVAGSMTDGVAIQAGAPIWNSDCAAHAEKCVADLPVVIRNTNEHRPVTVEGFAISDAPWYGYQRARSFVIAPRIVGPGAVFHHQLNGIKDTEWTRVVHAVVRFGAGRARRISSNPFVLTNASRDAAKQTCNRERGDWRASYSGRPYCVARTPDGGKTCRDGAECKGVCLVDGHEPVGPPEGPFRRQRWRQVGHCSEFVKPPSCYAPIPKGAASDPPAYYWVPSAMICSD